MTLEAGLCIFGFVLFCAFMVYALYLRAIEVDGSVQDDDWVMPIEHVRELADMESGLADNRICAQSGKDQAKERVRSVPTATPDKPLPKGWQGWEGSVLAPVQNGTQIVIMLRNGSIIPSCGGWCNWVHHECGGDIVAWRVAD